MNIPRRKTSSVAFRLAVSSTALCDAAIAGTSGELLRRVAVGHFDSAVFLLGKLGDHAADLYPRRIGSDVEFGVALTRSVLPDVLAPLHRLHVLAQHLRRARQE